MPESKSEFKIVHAVGQLPPGVERELEDYPMADAGGKYQAGCVSAAEPAPLSRLIFGAIASDNSECYVHFESGGFAHTYSARHYSLTGNKAVLLESSYVPEKCTDVESLKSVLKTALAADS